jgi:hypothetical protein
MMRSAGRTGTGLAARSVDERRGIGISVHYLASILQSRSLSELGANATVADVITSIVAPIVGQSVLSPGVPADCALTDTLRGLDTVGPPTVIVACPLGCTFFGLVQGVLSWCARSGKDPRKEYAWMRCVVGGCGCGGCVCECACAR